jgi:hypothetical protein
VCVCVCVCVCVIVRACGAIMRRNEAPQAAEAADLMRQNERDATERGEKLAELADRSEVPRTPQARGKHAASTRQARRKHARFRVRLHGVVACVGLCVGSRCCGCPCACDQHSGRASVRARGHANADDAYDVTA